MEDLEELVEKWEASGLLEGLTPIQKGITAMLYERVARHIIGLELILMSSGEKRAETVIFPIIYRIIKGNGRIDVVPLYNEVVDWFNHRNHMIQDISGYDMEAELTAIFCEEYLERTIDPITPKKFIRRWGK